MPRYRVEYSRNECIGAGVCAAVDPVNFVMDAMDGKANLVNSKQQGDKWILEIESNDISALKDAAEGCPVRIIKIFDSNGKQLV